MSSYVHAQQCFVKESPATRGYRPSRGDRQALADCRGYALRRRQGPGMDRSRSGAKTLSLQLGLDSLRGLWGCAESSPSDVGEHEGQGKVVAPTPFGPTKPTRLHADVALGPERLNRDLGKISDIAHLTSRLGTDVTITLEIAANPEGSDAIVRNVNENASTLKLTDHGFEDS